MTFYYLAPKRRSGNQRLLVHTENCRYVKAAEDERKSEVPQEQAMRQIKAGYGCSFCTDEVEWD